ncbi:hypothetical protein N7519_009137 [Penicillium mononematosum]|uniref:uncharacterized protein n=1 Tax=Penicillium mononematosum TaxID=268346 RepID=UPI002549A1AF|nr:uncharacterized protein N7519_009137 [Penicillium mononematosum]KAJ6178676.1 hypothetical protein N7519_009137 [Penicillium mononematosum]
MDAKHHQDRFITEQKVNPPPAFSLEPTSPESTAPGNADPLYPLLKRTPRLEKTNAHCVREKIPGVLHISDVLKRSPVQHPPTSLTSTDSSSLCVLTGFLNRGSPLPFLLQCRSSQVSLVSKFV